MGLSRLRYQIGAGLSQMPFILLLGCGVNPGSAPTAQDMIAAQAAAVSTLNAKGTVEEKSYPLGKGYAVDLSRATITDEDLRHLKTLATVAELNLSGSTISDEQFAKLAWTEYRMNVLYKIDISETQISDAGLRDVADLNLLAEVKAKGSKISDAGVKAFKDARAGKKLPFGMKLKIER